MSATPDKMLETILEQLRGRVDDIAQKFYEARASRGELRAVKLDTVNTMCESAAREILNVGHSSKIMAAIVRDDRSAQSVRH